MSLTAPAMSRALRTSLTLALGALFLIKNKRNQIKNDLFESFRVR
jgi:hypothetical protein